MEAVVNQPLGDVRRAHLVLELPPVRKDALVQTGRRVGQLIDVFQMLADEVRIQHRIARSLQNPFRPVGQDVGQRPHQYPEVAEEGAHAPNGLRPVEVPTETAGAFLPQDRKGQERLQDFLHCHRPGAGPAAAVGRRKSLVQVQVDDVGAELPRAGHSGQRVHVGPVQIDQPAPAVNNFGNLLNLFFKDAERVGVGNHQRRHFFVHRLAQRVEVELPVGIGRDAADSVAGDGGGGGVGAVGGVGNQHHLARVALRGQIGAHHQDAGQLSVRARRRLQGNGIHAGDFDQATFQQPQDSQAALTQHQRLVGVFAGESRQGRHHLVHPRVVLHGAGPQRIHPGVHAVVPGGEAGEVADNFNLAHFGEAFDLFAHLRRAQEFTGFRCGHVQRRQRVGILAG